MTPQELKQLPVFAGFKRNELDDIIQNAFEKELVKGDELFSKGDKRDVFFILLDGEIAIERELGDHIEIVEVNVRGEYIGEHALFDPNSTHFHTARVHSSMARILGIPGKRFHGLSMDSRYKLILNLLPLISDNFSHASNRIITITHVGHLLSTRHVGSSQLGKAILEILLHAIKAEKGLIALEKSDPTKVTVIATEGFSEPEDILYKTYPRGTNPIIDTVMDSAKSLNLREEEYRNTQHKATYAKKSVIVVPLQAEDMTVGVLMLVDKKTDMGFTTNNETLLNIIAKMIGVGLLQSEAHEIQEAEQELKHEYISM